MRYRYSVKRVGGVFVFDAEIHKGRPPPLGTTVEVKLVTGETVKGCVGAPHNPVSKLPVRSKRRRDPVVQIHVDEI